MLSWCALGVPFADLHLAMAWCAFWCALELDGMHEDPNLVQRIHKDLLDPGGLVITAGLQVVQVMLARVYLVMGFGREDDSTAIWWVLLFALVKFASLGPRSVWTSHGGSMTVVFDQCANGVHFVSIGNVLRQITWSTADYSSCHWKHVLEQLWTVENMDLGVLLGLKDFVFQRLDVH